MDLTLNGQPVQARAGETLLQLADRLGVPVPRLCAADGLRPDGNCRACVVDVAGERTLAASCCRAATPGLDVRTDSARALKSQQLVMQMLGVDPAQPMAKLLEARPQARDASHPAMVVNHDACIQCTRCVRACREEQGNDVLGMVGRGHDVRIAFDLNDPMGASSCVACGECVQACPTGAISARSVVDWLTAGTTAKPVAPSVAQAPSTAPASAWREVDTVCPFCGVGCQLTVQVAVQPEVSVVPLDALRATAKAPVVRERIVAVRGADGPANHNRLCVKGRFGLDYVHHPDRLTVPLVRREGVAKNPAVLDGLRQRLTTQPDAWREVFREATWDEALDLAANGLKRLRAAHGPLSLVGFGSAKGSNEEAYLFQKLVRTGFGSNNVDHCT
ncbi:MAG: 2Fe-2S iron-sulfur cluster-binding protein, partial [Burkholderiaceae bacterium]